MNFGWEKVVESKNAMRRELAALPIAEKLRMFDDLREREVALRSGRPPAQPRPDMLREGSVGYRASN